MKNVKNTITGFRQTWKNLENLEKQTFLKNLREIQGNSGKILIFGRKSGKTQGNFLWRTVPLIPVNLLINDCH